MVLDPNILDRVVTNSTVIRALSDGQGTPFFQVVWLVGGQDLVAEVLPIFSLTLINTQGIVLLTNQMGYDLSPTDMIGNAFSMKAFHAGKQMPPSPKSLMAKGMNLPQ